MEEGSSSKASKEVDMDMEYIHTNGHTEKTPHKTLEIQRLHSEDISNLINSLPYVDESYEENEAQISQMIQEEMNSFSPKDYLADFPHLEHNFKGSVFLENEYKRVSSGIKDNNPRLDLSRYSVLPPNKTDLNSWKLALRNAEAQFEHMNLRLENLELVQTYGSNAWRHHNTYLEGTQKRLSTILEGLKKEIDELNLQRKTEQGTAGITIRSLESKWMELVQKNYDISVACNALESEIAQLKQDQAQQLSRETNVQ